MKLPHSTKLNSRTEITAPHHTAEGGSDKRRIVSHYLGHFIFVLLSGLVMMQTPAYAAKFVLDENFSPSLNGRVREILVQSDGRVLIGGQFTTAGGASAPRFARLNKDGTLDSSFATGSGANNEVFALAQQDDGKIIIGGKFAEYNGSIVRAIARINPNGSLDSSFATTGPINGADSSVYELYITSNGQVIATGDFQNFNGVSRKRIVKLNSSDGSVDTSFDLEFNSRPSKIIPLDGNELLVTGYFTEITVPQVGAFVRGGTGLITEGGTLLSDFSGVGADNAVRDAIRLSNKQILIGGHFTSYNSIYKIRLVLFNSDNTMNSDFQATANGPVHALLPIGDDKIMLGGNFTEINGIARPYLALINLDGTLDPDFDFTPNNAVHTLVQDSKGNVFIGGEFVDINNTIQLRIAKLKLEDEDFCIVIKVKNGGLATPCL